MSEPGKTKKESHSHEAVGRYGDEMVRFGERTSAENVFIRNTSVSNFLLGFRRSELHVYSNTLSLCVGYYTLFLFSPHSSLCNTHTQIFFGCFAFFFPFGTPIFTCAFVGHIWLLFHYLFIVRECVLYMLHVLRFTCYKRRRYSLCYFLFCIYSATVVVVVVAAAEAANSSSEVFNASSTLMNYSNEPDIFATDLQREECHLLVGLLCYYFQLINV